MDLGLTNKVALVLASSKGLGKSVALELAKEGAHVAICGTDKEALKNAEQEIKQESSKKVISLQCDLTNELQRKNLIKTVNQKLGTIDILITNIGGPPPGSFESYDLDGWKNLFNFIFLSTVDVIRQVIPKMKAQNFGRIILITSIASKQPVDNLISSNSMRSGLVGFMKSLSNEYAPYGITVNNVMPGFTLTERLDFLMKQSPNLKNSKDSIPMKRFASPEEFAHAVTFLASMNASYITGISLPVDGGWIKGI
ncbi:SDR family oxidoreductase [Tenacibaculum xiamenense]|uniref:SDR family oxidoreductase n=1 Tax=Tenacibaculum xiamenense TaxID=1261553 RepID=UPI003894A437